MSSHHGILLHVVFSTKFRKPYLAEEWRDDLFGYIGGIVKDHKASLLKCVFGKPIDVGCGYEVYFETT